MTINQNAMLTSCLSRLPPVLAQHVQQHWQEYQTTCQQHALHPLQHADFIPSLCQVWASSKFVANNCLRYPKLLFNLFDSGDVLREYPSGELAERLKIALFAAESTPQLMAELRKFRRREMIRIAWRDLAGWSDLTHTMQELSELADACIDSSATILHRWQCEQWGTPRDAQYNMLPLIVVALGKLGAQELNFSSDVDLLFCYAKEGDITEQQSISHQQFFHRLGCQLMKVLHQTTCDGFVFRVDMRLRPYGDSGALVNSFATLKDYYQHSGRDWERYALIKARIISGYDHSSKRLLAIIRSFVYRRYIDFGMVEALRQLQQLISQEVRKKSLENNVKRGSGGIREIEFIGQTFKLIRGGLRVRLQERNTLNTLILLREMDCLSENIVEQLTKAYYFLRNIENRLQMYADQQTQTLPTETQQQISLVLAMKMDSWQQLLKELHQHTQIVHQTFTALIAKPNLQLDNPEADATFKMLQACWQQTLNKQQTIDFFTQQNIIQAEACWQILLTLHNHKPYQTLSAIAHQHLDSIMPRLLQISLQHENAYTVITRIITVIEALLREYNYLALLAENPIALSQLVKLCAASPWITLQIAHIPSLLDELLEPNNLYAPPDLATLKNHLQHYLLSIPEDDIEEQMHALRSLNKHMCYALPQRRLPMRYH